MRHPDNLADKKFWEDDYYARIVLPSRPGESSPYERTLAAALLEMAPAAKGQTVLEVGCAPARWLVWYAETFGAAVTGIEYSPKGAELSRRNFAASGVDGQVREGDFFSNHVGSDRFDVVLSLGFIEHFDNLGAAFERHVAFVKPGGTLAVGVPNFRGLIGALQRWGDVGYLELHNRAAMDPALYRPLAARHDLVVEPPRWIDFVDPDMVRVSRHGPAVVLLPLALLRRARFMDRINHRLLSSYLLMTFRRPV